MAKFPRNISHADILFLRVALVIILFWIAVWNLVEQLVDYLETEYRISRRTQYATLLVATVALILLDPEIFEKV